MLLRVSWMFAALVLSLACQHQTLNTGRAVLIAASEMSRPPESLTSNRCARSVVSDVRGLERGVRHDIAYRSGASKVGVRAPTSQNRRLGHRQSIARMHLETGRDAGDYLIVSMSTRRGNPGFEVVQLGTDATPGALGHRVGPGGKAPRRQRVVNWVGHDNGTNQTHYNHAGGFQLVGQVAIVPFEAYRRSVREPAGFGLWLLGPRSPVTGGFLRRQHAAPHGSLGDAGSLGVTRVSNGHYLLMLFGRHAREVEVFVSTGPYLGMTPSDWSSAGAWDLSTSAGTVAEGDQFRGYQNTQLVTQCDGQVFLLGALHVEGQDWLEAWKLVFDERTLAPTFTHVAASRLRCGSRLGKARRFCSFNGGSGPYIDPSGRLLYYAVEPRACVGGGCTSRRRGDGYHVGVREFVPRER